jgi:hypothetical protein
VSRFYEPDPSIDPNSPFVRDAVNKLVRRGYWMDMNDRTLIMVMTQGIGKFEYDTYLAAASSNLFCSIALIVDPPPFRLPHH